MERIVLENNMAMSDDFFPTGSQLVVTESIPKVIAVT